ncbi:MAG: hypothetical protein JWR39_1502 [Devosia sp.]|nr:hypothetical protein [Devosia sp.]
MLPMALDLAQIHPDIFRYSRVELDPAGPLLRMPMEPGRTRPPAFWEKFDATHLFYDVFRDHSGRHVYLIGPMALNLGPMLEAMTVTGQPSGTTVRLRVHQAIQATIARATLPPGDNILAMSLDGQSWSVPIQPNQSVSFDKDRIILAVNKDNELPWITDWARFYVKEHGATAAVLYDNGSTSYSMAELTAALAGVDGLEKFLVIPWPFRFGTRDHGFSGHRFGENWARFAQPPLFTHFFRKYSMHARSMLSVDIDELVVSPFRKSVFKAVEQAPFGLVRFNRIWVLNKRASEGLPRHADYVIRKRGAAARDRGKKWGVAPGRAFLASWRAQMWTHQVRGWFNLAGSRNDFYGYHFRGISHAWNYDRSDAGAFDPKLHERDQLLIKTFADVFGSKQRR